MWGVVIVVLVLFCAAATKQDVLSDLEDGELSNSLLGMKLDELSETHLKQLLRHSRHRRSLIYPGTKWCGDGDVASNDDDLGSKAELDKCCRKHDHCNEFIPANHTRYGLHNTQFHTSSHCDCDEAFRQCLMRGNSFHFILIAELYFEGAICIRYDYPAACISWRSRNKDYRCTEYKFDKKKKKRWQFFDVLPWNYQRPANKTGTHTTPHMYTTATPMPERFVSQGVGILRGSSITLLTLGVFVVIIWWQKERVCWNRVATV